MSDEIEKNLRSLQGVPLVPRPVETQADMQKLIEAVGGPLTALNIRKARKTYAVERIPFLFSSIDPQLVVDVMACELDEVALEMARRNKEKKKNPG